jgi:hypothetical protein
MANYTAFVSLPCIGCGNRQMLILEADKVERYYAGAHVQDIWPELDADTRELIMTGTCPECWNKFFDDKEDDFNDAYKDFEEALKEEKYYGSE